MDNFPQCAKCSVGYCSKMPLEEINKAILPEYCPMKTSGEVITSVIEKYGKDDVKRIYVPATRLLGHNPVIALYSDYHKDIVELQKRT